LRKDVAINSQDVVTDSLRTELERSYEITFSGSERGIVSSADLNEIDHQNLLPRVDRDCDDNSEDRLKTIES
jgi:hypothetical protein